MCGRKLGVKGEKRANRVLIAGQKKRERGDEIQ